MRIISLFSGIGGLELGIEAAVPNAKTIIQVEQNEYCRQVLAKHWPNAKRYNDVREVDGSKLPQADLICAGFPCQDISAAGKGAGLAGARSGLWYECARIIAESRPAWVVVENVASGAKRWVDAVRRQLEQLGYETLPVPIAAADVGAPHLRRRVFIIAHTVSLGLRDEWQRQPGRRTDGVRPQRHSEPAHTSSTWSAANEGWAPGPPVCGVDDGLPTRMDRNRLKALGNAVVPQCAQVIGEIINLLRKDTA